MEILIPNERVSFTTDVRWFPRDNTTKCALELRDELLEFLRREKTQF